jgi:preprotein translocase subunit SecE
MTDTTQNSVVDKLKLVVAVALVISGIAGYYWLAASSILLRILSVIAGIAAGIGVALTSGLGQEFVVFAREALAEVKKVVWPTRKETIQTTAAVFAFVVVMAVYLWVSDKTLEWVLYDLILGWKKT